MFKLNTTREFLEKAATLEEGFEISAGSLDAGVRIRGMEEPVLVSIPGEGRFLHTCLKCKISFRDSARNTRFCTKLFPEKECQKKYAGMKKARKREYDNNAAFYRVKSQCHSLARSVLALEVFENRRTQQCNHPGCDIMNIELLEAHHRNANIFDCRPENLDYLCKPHHAQAQSSIRTDGGWDYVI